MDPSLHLVYVSTAIEDLLVKRYAPDWIRLLQIWSVVDVIVLGWLLYHGTVSLIEGFAMWNVVFYLSVVVFLYQVTSQVVTRV